jgi:hypothetical protein
VRQRTVKARFRPFLGLFVASSSFIDGAGLGAIARSAEGQSSQLVALSFPAVGSLTVEALREVSLLDALIETGEG